MEEVDSLASLLRCKVGRFLTSYLHLPLGVPHKLWDVVEERFSRRLASWKKQYLSKGDSSTLIKSTLLSQPIYFMSFAISKREKHIRKDSKRFFMWKSLERQQDALSELA